MDDFQKALQVGGAWLERVQRGVEDGLVGPGQAGSVTNRAPTNPSREIADFGDNPGNLRMFMSAPALSTGVATSLHAHAGAAGEASRRPGEPERSPALVIALHGCLQTPESYDRGSGWSQLAERHGFALVMPSQRPANNANRCFNWFAPEHAAGDAGEARSIRRMIDYMVTNHGIDPARVFVAGLSAGGAMAASLLAIYPGVFAAGAVLSGLPFGAASTLPEALASMAQGRKQSASQWGGLARAASTHTGPWPRLSVWHGGADAVVHPANAEGLIAQWRDLHGLAKTSEDETVAGHRRRVWRGSDGREVLESFTIAGMGHGVALAAGRGAGACGSVGPFHLEAGICSTSHILRFWGLAADADASLGEAGHAPHEPPQARSNASPAGAGLASAIPDEARVHITEALRLAGLLDPATRGGTDPRGMVETTLRSLGLLKP